LSRKANVADRAAVEVDFHLEASSRLDPALNEGLPPSQGRSTEERSKATMDSFRPKGHAADRGRFVESVTGRRGVFTADNRAPGLLESPQ
jgi:hypothetical protein